MNLKIKNEDLIEFLEFVDLNTDDMSVFGGEEESALNSNHSSFSSSCVSAPAAVTPSHSFSSSSNMTSNASQLKKQQIDKARGEFERRYPDFRLVYTSAADQHCCFKNAKCRELDAEIGDISLEICDIELQILEWLQSLFIQSSHIFAETIDVSAELDCLMAFAQVAQENEFVRPNLKLGPLSTSFIDADCVRHPFAHLSFSETDGPVEFVSNPIKSADGLSDHHNSNKSNWNKIKVEFNIIFIKSCSKLLLKNFFKINFIKLPNNFR